MTEENLIRPPQSRRPSDLLSEPTNERQQIDPEHYEKFDSFHSFLKNATEENENKVKSLDNGPLQKSPDDKKIHKLSDIEHERQISERQQLEQSYMEEFASFHSMYTNEKRVETRNSAKSFWIRMIIITTLLSLACFATWIGLLLESEIYESNENKSVHHSFEMATPLSSNALNDHCNTICKLSKCCHFPNSARRSCLKVQSRCDDLDKQCKHACHSTEEIQENDREIVERITDSCNKDMMKNPRDIMKCSRLCAPRMCCFVSSDDTNDSECVYREQNCSTFSQCTILNMENDDINDESIVDVGTVSDACSIDNILSNEGYGICQRLCWKRACCFLPESEGGCYSRTGEKWCEEFGACRNLMKIQPHKVVGGNKF